MGVRVEGRVEGRENEGERRPWVMHTSAGTTNARKNDEWSESQQHSFRIWQLD